VEPRALPWGRPAGRRGRTGYDQGRAEGAEGGGIGPIRAARVLLRRPSRDILNCMVNYQPLTDTFAALADPTRRAVVERLATRGEAPVSALASEHEMSLPAFLKHVRVLERAGLLTTSKVGRVRRCRLAPLPLAEAERWMHAHRAFWEAQLESLDRFLSERPHTEEV